MPTRIAHTPINPAEDTWIREGSPTYNGGTATSLSIGLLSGKGVDDRRALLKFDLSGYLSAASFELVTKVELVLTGVSGALPNGGFVRKVTQDFDASLANWNTYDGSTSWATLGGDYEDEDSHSFSSAVGEIRIDITDIAVSVLKSGGTDLLLILMADSGASVSGFNIRSLDYATVGERPAIEIEYASRSRRLTRSSTGG